MRARSTGLVLAAAAAALSCGSGDLRPGACSADRDCSGARLCIDNRCDSAPGVPAADAGATGTAQEVWYVSQPASPDVDILFAIGNEIGMTPLQEQLIASFPAFTQALAGLPAGLPNVHIGVVSGSMGAGAFTPGQCPTGGDQGVLQAEPHGVCTGTGLGAGQSFISNVGGQANYTGALEDVFACIAALGDGGCAFQAPFASVVRALGADGEPPPPDNAGFLRPDALLAVVVVTDQDDCSVPPDSTLFDPSSQLVSDPLGPLQYFRCAEFGLLCYGAPPSRTTAQTYPPGACVSAEGAGMLEPIARTVAQLKGLKPNPRRALVSILGGPADPFTVELTPPLGVTDPAMWPQVTPACAPGSETILPILPGIRLAALAAAFGDQGQDLTLCASSVPHALQAIAGAIGKALGPTCIDGVLADGDIATPGLQPDCQVADLATDAHGGHTLSPIPSCAASGGAAPCWTLADGTGVTCPGQHLVTVARATPPSPDLLTRVSCSVCAPGATDPGCP
jgi:hypothetical protein